MPKLNRCMRRHLEDCIGTLLSGWNTSTHTMSNDGATVAVKLFLDKEKQRVLLAESDNDFVDVLFSFLTLPLGTIVRLLGKQSGAGCLDEVYKSVESLSIDHFQTKACKAMLLSPLNAAANQLPENFIQQPKHPEHKFDPIKIKPIQTKDDASVLYAEAGQDFVDLIFGLLSIPPGSIIKAYGQWSPNGCIDNLYRNIAGIGHIKSLARFLTQSANVAKTCSTLGIGRRIMGTLHLLEETLILGFFVNGCFKFIITDDLIVAPA
ncbi:uncharacterized protein [Setaria viridis]|uniref:uncharacterized protein n=1 Tax=Setaria viridis TaxID=4556 RepID=UPI003B3B74B0